MPDTDILPRSNNTNHPSWTSLVEDTTIVPCLGRPTGRSLHSALPAKCLIDGSYPLPKRAWSCPRMAWLSGILTSLPRCVVPTLRFLLRSHELSNIGYLLQVQRICRKRYIHTAHWYHHITTAGSTCWLVRGVPLYLTGELPDLIIDPRSTRQTHGFPTLLLPFLCYCLVSLLTCVELETPPCCSNTSLCSLC